MNTGTDDNFNIILFWDRKNDHIVAPFQRIKSTDSEEIYHTLDPNFRNCAIRDDLNTNTVKFLKSDKREKIINSYMKIKWMKNYHIGAYVKEYTDQNLIIKFRGYENNTLNVKDPTEKEYFVKIGNMKVKLKDIDGNMSWYINNTIDSINTKVNTYVNKNYKLDYLSIESDNNFFTKPEIVES